MTLYRIVEESDGSITTEKLEGLTPAAVRAISRFHRYEFLRSTVVSEDDGWVVSARALRRWWPLAGALEDAL